MRELLMDLSNTPKKVSNLKQTLDTSIHVTSTCDQFVILASNLKHENQKLLGLVAARHRFKILTTYRYNPIFFIYFLLFFFKLMHK